ncbi:ANK_REP_REGION domain-containing protein [Haematococcus lacustris]|uniref:ANK_REP_REGION domain-containing protein n=1 Tax=Haematococcus lacustris TaxID=44745 RepID=A0A699YEE8_HAELA|nr:ANK_REP_REGION domain-containing protein [Haematococcus lacustris]
MSLVSTEGFIEVEAVEGIRLVPEGQQAVAEYLIKWKGDFQALCAMLEGGRDVLAQALDENRRSALHFAAALGKQDCVRLLLEAGANPNLQDKDGYTPLHMAAGYMHTQAMAVLLEGGSDPQLRDNTGKDVVKLIDNIRGNMPLNVATIMQRLRLEEVCNALTDMVYEEVGITAILDERKADDGSREFLVSFSDGREDGWVAQRNVAADILADYEAGLEYRRARAIVDMVQVGTERRFKIQWEDDYPTSWEPEEHVPPNLIALFQRQNPALFEERVNAANDVDASSGVKREALDKYKQSARQSAGADKWLDVQVWPDTPSCVTAIKV